MPHLSMTISLQLIAIWRQRKSSSWVGAPDCQLLLGTEDGIIATKEQWVEGRRPNMSMMNLWVAAHSLFKDISPADFDVTALEGEPPKDIVRQLDKELGQIQSGKSEKSKNGQTFQRLFSCKITGISAKFKAGFTSS